ncbi:MAG: DNA-binding protein [Verrucomicrobiae bacterium]|nr:DNA-binding protein [Verrucomicrobiae bacterium]
MRTHALRLHPGDDPKVVLDALARAEGWSAACVLSAVGSLTRVALRFANQPEATSLTGHFELVSLTGTLSADGSHLHLAISDSTGTTRGGHLEEGSSVFTTAEIVLGILDDWRFSREPDPESGFNELVIAAI